MDDRAMDREMGQSLGRLEGKIDLIIAEQQNTLARNIQHENRLRILEDWRWRIVGMATAFASVVSIMVTYILKTIGVGQ